MSEDRKYCSHCGRSIDDNSRFCKHCGKAIGETDRQENSHGCLISFIVVILVIVFIVFAVSKVIDASSPNSDGKKELTSRSARNSDLEIESSEDFSLSIDFNVTPECDIDDLELTFSFYDKNKDVLTTKVKNVGNVKEGVEYSISFSLSEFSFSNMFTIESVSCSVTGGTVSYLA